MMPDDKLTHEERRRLESVNQAIAFAHTRLSADAINIENLLCVAAIIEVFLRDGKIEPPGHIDEESLRVKVMN